MGTISSNFSYKEFEVTDLEQYHHDNIIRTVEVRDNIKALVDNVLQPLRDICDKPLYINSGYRCPALNAAVGGAKTSQHVKGQAADVCPFGERNGHGDISEVERLASLAKAAGLPYDQMILYPTFVHFSHKADKPNRGQILYSSTYRGKKI